VVRAPLDDVVRMVFDSRIRHGPSCVLILKAREHLARRADQHR